METTYINIIKEKLATKTNEDNSMCSSRSHHIIAILVIIVVAIAVIVVTVVVPARPDHPIGMSSLVFITEELLND